MSNEITFVPHLVDTKDVIDRSNSAAKSNNDDELTTVIIDTGNKFAYDTINNNEEIVFAGNNATNLGGERRNGGRSKKTKPSNEDVEQSSPMPRTNIVVNENNEKQESLALDDVVKSQMESSSREHIGNTTADVDTTSNSKGNRNVVETTASSMASKNEISAVAINTSTEKSLNDFEIQRFISEHIKYKSNNVTIKKSWGKWSAWSGCSRSCNEGVMSQSRECTEKT